jgi:hypothetical protein
MKNHHVEEVEEVHYGKYEIRFCSFLFLILRTFGSIRLRTRGSICGKNYGFSSV